MDQKYILHKTSEFSLQLSSTVYPKNPDALIQNLNFEKKCVSKIIEKDRRK